MNLISSYLQLSVSTLVSGFCSRINYFSFRVNPCNPCLIYISLRDFSVLFEVLVDGIYLFNDECHFVF